MTAVAEWKYASVEHNLDTQFEAAFAALSSNGAPALQLHLYLTDKS